MNVTSAGTANQGHPKLKPCATKTEKSRDARPGAQALGEHRGGRRASDLLSILVLKSSASPEEDLDSKLGDAKSRISRSRSLGAFLRASSSPGEVKRKHADKLASCGSYQSWLLFRTLGEARLEMANFCCQPRLCAWCAAGRSVRQALASSARVENALAQRPELRPYMLTLTVKANTSLLQQSDELLGAVRRANWSRRHNTPWSEFQGGILSCEAKRATGDRGHDEDGKARWHFHAHAIVLGRPGLVDRGGIFWREGESDRSKGYARGPLAEQWSGLLKYSANSDLRPLRCSAAMDHGRPVDRDRLTTELMEVFKYALKMNELSYIDQWDAFCMLAGKRLLRSWGCLYGKLPETVEPASLKDFYGLPFVRRLYHFLYQEFTLTHEESGESYQGKES